MTLAIACLAFAAGMYVGERLTLRLVSIRFRGWDAEA